MYPPSRVYTREEFILPWVVNYTILIGKPWKWWVKNKRAILHDQTSIGFQMEPFSWAGIAYIAVIKSKIFNRPDPCIMNRKMKENAIDSCILWLELCWKCITCDSYCKKLTDGYRIFGKAFEAKVWKRATGTRIWIFVLKLENCWSELSTLRSNIQPSESKCEYIWWFGKFIASLNIKNSAQAKTT